MTPAAKPPLVDNAAWIAMAAALIAMAGMLFAPQVFNDPDTWWHLAAGQWMLANGKIPHTDPFSYTMAGKPWQAHEWLSEVLMAAGYQLAGWRGVLVLYAGAAGLAAGLLARTLSRWLAGLSLPVTVLLAFACVSGSFLARPHLLALPLMIAWAAELLIAREEERAPHLAYAAIVTVWANLHGSFVFAYVLLAPFALEAVLAAGDRRKALVRWGLFGIISVAAALLTPHGVSGLILCLLIWPS